MTTSAQLPLCVFCGTERPADRTSCPRCGRPWIDVRVGSLAEAEAEAEARVLVGAAITTELAPTHPATETADTTLAVDLTEDEDEPDDSPTTMPRWAIPAVLGVSAVLVIAMFGFGLLDGGGEGEAAPDSTTATTAAPATTTPTTTAPTTTAAPATTTAPTTTLPAPGSLVASGDPIPVAALALHADGIGPIEIGTGATEAIGRLVASLGEPEEITATGPDDGLCEGEEGRVVRWAGLNAIVSGTIEGGTFVAYRYQHPEVPVSHLDLATPSGIHIGDTLATLNEVYAPYDITYQTDGTTSTFTLSDGDQLLLWGPVSSTESSGQVEGIFSAPPCPTA